MNWFERNLYKIVWKNRFSKQLHFPCCNDFILYLSYTHKLHKFKYVSVVQYDDINDIYVHDTLLQDFDLDLFDYGHFPVYNIMCLTETILLQIDICDY